MFVRSVRFYPRPNKLVQNNPNFLCIVVSTEDKDHAWIHSSTTERGSSPMSSPTYEHPPRPYSTSSASSFSGQTGSPTTHVAVLANALSFVTNKAGDYLVKLVIHVPLTTTSGCKSIHLSQLPRCRSNFIKFSVEQRQPQGEEDQSAEIEFNIHPPVMSPEEAHLNPESDEDAQFWQDVQEYIVDDKGTDRVQDTPSENGDLVRATLEQVTGCFAPTSSLHMSWMSKDTACLVQKVEQDMTIHISGLPDQTKSSSLLKDRKRKDPEDSHPLQDPDDEPIEYEHLEMDDADLVISAEGILTAVVEKQGWKKPFIDLTLEHTTIENGQPSDISLIEIVGDSVHDWELVGDKEDRVQDLDAMARESTDLSRNSALTYRVWFFMGTEGTVTIRVNFCVSQPVTVGYGQDITCSIPRIRVQGATNSTGRVQVSSSNDLLIQRSSTRQMETILADSPLYRDDAMINKRQGMQYQYSSPDYDLSVVVHRYKTLSRIARIERIRAEIGVSSRRQPGFAKVTLSDVVLPEQDDLYLRIYQLDGAEIWSITVDGKPCSKSVQLLDRKVAGNRTVLVPIPCSPQDTDQQHSIEISYGFDSVDHDFIGGDDSVLDSPIRLLIPGFSLPVGEYIVVANLPRLDRGIDSKCLRLCELIYLLEMSTLTSTNSTVHSMATRIRL